MAKGNIQHIKISAYQHINILVYQHINLQKTAGYDANGEEEESKTESSHWVIIFNWPTTVGAEVPDYFCDVLI